MWTHAIVGVAALLASGCAQDGVFACRQSVECESHGRIGRCEHGWCAFPDDNCASGLRWGEHAPDGVAGVCTTWLDDDVDDTNADDDGGVTKGPPPTSEAESGVDDQSLGGESTSEGDGTSTAGLETGDADEPLPSCELDFADEFIGEELDRRWNLAAMGGVGPVFAAPQNGALHVSMISGFEGSTWIEMALGQFEHRAVELETWTPPQEQYTSAHVTIRSDVVHRIEIGGDRLRIVDALDDEAAPALDIAFDPIAHRFVRIAAEGGAVRYETAPDGATWTTLHVTAAQGVAAFTTLELGLTVAGPTLTDPETTLDRVSACTFAR